MWVRVNHPFKYIYFLYITSEVNCAILGTVVLSLYTDLGQNFFLALFKPIILQFFTILEDKLHSFNQSRTIEARASFAQH